MDCASSPYSNTEDTTSIWIQFFSRWRILQTWQLCDTCWLSTSTRRKSCGKFSFWMQVMKCYCDFLKEKWIKCKFNYSFYYNRWYNWPHNGPDLGTRILASWCGQNSVSWMTPSHCKGFKILSNKSFLPNQISFLAKLFLWPRWKWST